MKAALLKIVVPESFDMLGTGTRRPEAPGVPPAFTAAGLRVAVPSAPEDTGTTKGERLNLRPG